MIRPEIEVTASVIVFSIDFVVQCSTFPDDQHVQKSISLPVLGASCLKMEAEPFTET